MDFVAPPDWLPRSGYAEVVVFDMGSLFEGRLDDFQLDDFLREAGMNTQREKGPDGDSALRPGDILIASPGPSSGPGHAGGRPLAMGIGVTHTVRPAGALGTRWERRMEDEKIDRNGNFCRSKGWQFRTLVVATLGGVGPKSRGSLRQLGSLAMDAGVWDSKCLAVACAARRLDGSAKAAIARQLEWWTQEQQEQWQQGDPPLWDPECQPASCNPYNQLSSLCRLAR